MSLNLILYKLKPDNTLEWFCCTWDDETERIISEVWSHGRHLGDYDFAYYFCEPNENIIAKYDPEYTIWRPKDLDEMHRWIEDYFVGVDYDQEAKARMEHLLQILKDNPDVWIESSW